MQIIPDNMNAGMHVFETPNDIIINSQIYDKITMEPKPYNFFNINYCLNNKNLLLHEINILEYPWAMIAKEPDYKYYIQDNQNSDIFYCITEQSSTDQNQYIHKIKKTDMGWQILNTIAPDSGYRYGVNGNYGETLSTPLHYKILGQTKNYIVLIQINSGISYGYNRTNQPRLSTLTYIIINKIDMTYKYLDIGVYYDYSVYLLKETNNYIYIFENLAGRLRIVNYNPDVNIRTEIFSKDINIDDKCIGISNIIKFKDKYYILTGNSSNTYYAFQELTIDFEHNKVTCIEKTLEKDSNFLYHNATGRTDFLDCAWLQIDLKNIDDTYISITIHDNTNKHHGYGYYTSDGYKCSNGFIIHDQTILSQAQYHRHILYKYNETNNSWKTKGIITPDKETQHIYGVLYYNQYTPIFFLNDKILIYKLNLNTEQYEKCFEKAGIFYTIGLDELNNFYIFDDNNNCSIYNECTSNELFAEFEKESYDYEDIDIDTYVTIYSKNFLGDYINTKVKITIEGDCYFKENNLQEIITNTDTELVQIPVTITNSGIMYCHIEEV